MSQLVIPAALLLAAALAAPALAAAQAAAPSPPPDAATVESPHRDGPPPGAPFRHDDDPRQDGEHHRRHGRFRGDPLEFGPPVAPAGVTVPNWDQLTPQQQEQLQHHRDDWDQMPASRRVRALEWLERRARWDALPPEEREQLREGARNFRDMSPEQREKMRLSLQATRALPEEERRRLFDLWHGLSPEQRRAWLDAGGPGIAPAPQPAD